MQVMTTSGSTHLALRARLLHPLLLAALLLLASPARPDGLPLWELRGDTNRVFILGSIHFLRPGEDRLPDRVLSAYEDADVVVMELDLDDLDPLASAAVMQRLGTDPDGRPLAVLLGSRDYEKAAAKAQAIGIDLALLSAYEPWLAAITLTQLKLQMLGFDASAGVEQQLLALAQRDRKEIKGLETLEEQLEAMDQLPPATQRDFLLATLDEAADIENRIGDIVSAWRTGDLRAMEADLLDGMRDQPELYRRIVVERNRNWVRKIEALARGERDVLVVVGTLHLVGRDSLIKMLGEAGHAPRQLH